MNEGADSDTEGDGAEYKAFFAKALKKFGVSSPGELKGDDEKKFYDYIDANWKADDEKPESYMIKASKKKKIVVEKSAVQSSWDMTEKSLTSMAKLLSPKGMLSRTITAESGNNVIKEFTIMSKHMGKIMEQWEAVERAGNMNESFIAEAAKVMAKKGDYAFSKYRNGEVEVTHKGKVLATGDFDSGADSFFMDVPGTKGQKSFNSADDVIKFFVNMKENLRKDISQLSSKFPEGSNVKMPNGKIAKVVSVSKDSVKVAVGNKTMDHDPSDLESVDEEVKVDVDGDSKIRKDKKEGNAFTGALNAAREKGDATFIVAGKKYKVEDMDGDEAEEDEADFVPHKMYKDGKVANADTKEEHERLADLGWTHVKPESYH